MDLDLRALAENIRKAETEELLDRVTVFRHGMEPVALDLIEGELSRRGVGDRDIAEHAAMRRETALLQDDGTPVRCGACDRPAVTRRRGWYRLWGRVPLFPQSIAYCEEHRPDGDDEANLDRMTG